ncbi:dihydrodipicolinate synthase family protein [Novosphingobium pentaromativorans]|uniref:2-hydroxybenzalpyruvate aldolase n=2 Tax=Novosphingobium pentaromativorans TaxID=205844 RepID=G6EGL8_9SPHN|nr:2-hydroxybenzalpyruvate aldolase [Novosphingobium pentaromativorans US6-1]
MAERASAGKQIEIWRMDVARRKELLTVDSIRGAWAIIPTPSKPNASDWREANTVDLDETARAIEALIEAGVDGILSFGTLGECATLTRQERHDFVATAVETVRGRVPFFTGTTTLSTRDTIELTREASDLGADGTMIGLPMWCPADTASAVGYVRSVAEACPEMAISIYANPGIFQYDFPAPFWAQLSEIPQVVTAKLSSRMRWPSFVRASKNRIRLMPIDLEYYAAARIDPEFMTAFWTTGAVCGPKVVTTFRDEVVKAKQTGDWHKAKEISDAMVQSTRPLFPRGDPHEFAKHNIALEKARMDAAGWIKAGPCRPPYHNTPQDFLDGAAKAGRNWADLEAKVQAGQPLVSG